MYINLILGAVGIFIAFRLLRRLFFRDDVLAEHPSVLLEREMASREGHRRAALNAAETLAAEETARLRPVVKALEDLAAAMPQEARQRLSWEDGGTTLVVRMALRRAVSADSPETDQHERATDTQHIGEIAAAGQEGGSDDACGVGEGVLTIAWRVPALVIGAAGPGRGEYHLHRSGTTVTTTEPDLDGCVRVLTSFLVDFIPCAA